jgi:predicted TIM-barrel fold metal-dependent hydrolase
VRNGTIEIGEQQMLGMPAYMLDCRALAEYFVAEMDALGVSAGVVVQEYLDGEQNDYLMKVAEQFPGRFFMHGLPNWFEPDTVASEIAGLLEQGFRGIKLPACHLLNQLELDDARLLPAYRMIAEADAVLAVDLSFDAQQVPAFRRVMDANQSMKVAIGHFGVPSRGGWPGQLELCDFDNVYIETGGIVWLYRHAGVGFEPALDAIGQAIERVGADKIMWGSDWPRTMTDFTYEQSLAFLRDTDMFPPITKQKLLGGNAQRLYGLSAATPRSALRRITEG